MAVASAGPYANLHLHPDTTTPASHHSVFDRLDALPATQPTASKLEFPESVFIIKHYKLPNAYIGSSLASLTGFQLGATTAVCTSG